MIQVTPHMRILACHVAVDFRRGMDRLAQMCRQEIEADPFCGIVFLFRNRSQTGIKILVYDGTGFWLCHKRLSSGRFPWWPTDKRGRPDEIAVYELQVLMAAGNPERVVCAPEWRRVSQKELWPQQPCVHFPAAILSPDERDSEIPWPRSDRGRCAGNPGVDRGVPGIESCSSFA